jgi:hypothetical protein
VRKLALAFVLLASCSAKDDATLVVSTRNPALAKVPNAFGAKLEGGVDVSFDLGAYSGAPVTVEAIQLGLYRGNTQILPGATIQPPAGTTFPLTLNPGDKPLLHYTISKPQLLADEQTALCAGPVTITGMVKQSGKPDLAIGADPITATGCP